METSSENDCMQKLPYKQLFKIEPIGKRQISSHLAATKPDLAIRMDPWKVHPTLQIVRQILSSSIKKIQDEFAAQEACSFCLHCVLYIRAQSLLSHAKEKTTHNIQAH